MATTYNIIGSQTVTGSLTQDRFYAFTRNQSLNDVQADATVVSFSWASGIRTSATTFFNIFGSNIQLSSDFYSGGEATDIIYGSNLNDGIFYNNGVISGGIGSFSAIEQFVLGAGDDIIDLSGQGPSGVDYAKSVIVHGDEGNDTIIGGAGTDTLYGDDGNDVIFGYRGADTLHGGAGDDTLYGDDLGFNGIAGDDLIYGQAGNDILYGGARTDRLEGGDGNDTLYGGAGGDTLLGGADDDVLYGDDLGVAGNDTLLGDAGNDQLFGGDGSDELMGGTGNDVVNGGNGSDYLDGEGGDDTLIGGEGNDTIYGGMADTDTAVYSGNASDYTVIINPDGTLTITDVRFGSPDGIDTLRHVELIQFADGTVPSPMVNSAPVINSNGGGNSASLSVAENSTLVTTVTATDANNGQTISYSIGGGPDDALFSINAITGALSFVTSPNFESPTDFGADNVYIVVVRATDDSGAYDFQVLSVSVTDVADGSAPVITSNGGGATATIDVSENATSVTNVQASDAEGTAPVYSIVGGADAALFTIDPETGALVFNSAPDFEIPTDRGGDGVYDVIVQASDGSDVDLQQISVRVGNVNDNAPVILSASGGASAALSVSENSVAVVKVSAIDADHTTPTYAIAGGADAAFFSIDPLTGELVFKSAPDFEKPVDAGLNNVYDVIVRATDGTNFDDQTLEISVTDVNEAGKTITGSTGNNTISPTQSNFGLRTTGGNDIIYALAGNDIIDGGDGADRMDGGTGNDTYFVGQLSHDGDNSNDDLVIEAAASGTDLVNSTVSYILTPNVENLTLVGSGEINGMGNDLNNVITGNNSNNILSGGVGNDTLNGMVGNDIIWGGTGNDSLDGGAGIDWLDGGAGNDVYFVDTYSVDGISSNDDQVFEIAGGGTDTVNSAKSYILTDHVENLTLTGSGTSGTGNNLDNVIKGSGSDNMLFGLGGADTINGNDGEDRLYGGDGNDILNGGNERDALFGEAGNDTLVGGADGDQLDGGAGADSLNGQSGGDLLMGGLGRDTLTGGVGDNDVFGFGLADSTVSSASCDVITDFETDFDEIRLSFSPTQGGFQYSEAAIASSSYNDALAGAQAMVSAGTDVVFMAGLIDGWLFWDTDNNGIIDQSILLKGLTSVNSMSYDDITPW
ncbi:MAG: cadherin domain-containing protein [Sphingorhabdus sp.]